MSVCMYMYVQYVHVCMCMYMYICYTEAIVAAYFLSHGGCSMFNEAACLFVVCVCLRLLLAC